MLMQQQPPLNVKQITMFECHHGLWIGAFERPGHVVWTVVPPRGTPCYRQFRELEDARAWCDEVNLIK